MIRWLKLKYLQLLRAKGGPAKVAKGFCIGFAVEMFTLPTAGLAFFLIFPLAYFLRGSFAAALIGFVIGKIVYIPLAFVNKRVGAWILPEGIESKLRFLPDFLDPFIKLYLALFVGGLINGVLIALVLYYPLKKVLEWVYERRLRRRKDRIKHSPS